MVHPIKMDLEEKTHFLEASESFDEGLIENALTRHLSLNGYDIGKHNVDQLTQDEFAEMRANTFGASDSSVLLEVAYSSKKVPMKTREDLLMEKINKDWDESIGMKAAVRKGRELEPLIIDKISDLIGGTVIKPKHMYISTFGDGLATNFDGVVLEAQSNNDELTDHFIPVPMEIKVCSFFGRSNYNWNKAVSEFEDNIPKKLVAKRDYIEFKTTDPTRRVEEISDVLGIPKYYFTQLQQQMMFLGAPHGYLAVMDDIDWTLYFYKVPRDEPTMLEIGKRAHELYQYLLKRS